MMKHVVVLCTLLSASTAFGQSPPLGPPESAPGLPQCNADRTNTPCFIELGAFFLTAALRGQTQLSVDSANASLASQGRSSRVSIAGIDQWKPRRIQTQALDEPNSWRILIPYGIELEVSIPWTSNRRIHIPMDVEISCDGWHNGTGRPQAHFLPGPASFEGGNILEDVFNVGNYIDAQVRSGFTAPTAQTLSFVGTCSALSGTDLGTELVNDDAIVWTVPRARRIITDALKPTIQVTFDRLTRLQAHTLDGGILYQPSEDFYLNAWANYTLLQKQLTMSEGDSVALDLPMVSLDARVFDTLVVLANIEQPPYDPRDSAYAASTKAVSYAPGAHVLRIPKWYSEPPNQFHRKPIWRRVDAYELAYTVRYVDNGAVLQQTSGATLTGGGNSVAPGNVMFLDAASTTPASFSLTTAR